MQQLEAQSATAAGSATAAAAGPSGESADSSFGNCLGHSKAQENQQSKYPIYGRKRENTIFFLCLNLSNLTCM